MIKAESKFIRTSPRKIRLVADLVRNMSLKEALDTLTHLRKRAAKPLLKTIKQAVANAVNNLNLDKNSLEIQSIEVNEGSTYKRWNPVSRGRAHSIFKRTSHIKVILNSNQKQTKVLTGNPTKTRIKKQKIEKTTQPKSKKAIKQKPTLTKRKKGK